MNQALETSSQWWCLKLRSPNPEEDSCTLMEIGAQGVQILDDGELHAYFEGTAKQLAHFSETLKAESFSILQVQEVQQRNWLQDCQELWQTIQLDKIEVIPVASSESALNVPQTPDRETIFIIPSTGFGTGHHATTYSLLQFLEHPNFEQHPPAKVLDLGTGSGILAICAARLFSYAQIDAIEPDPEAIRNANDNIELNKVGDRIRLVQGQVECAEQHYDLILANIYAEVLCPLKNDFATLLNSQGILLLSGIAESKVDMIKEAYSDNNFTWQNEVLRDGWFSAWLIKV